MRRGMEDSPKPWGRNPLNWDLDEWTRASAAERREGLIDMFGVEATDEWELHQRSARLVQVAVSHAQQAPQR
jgi:hypothetical protein